MGLPGSGKTTLAEELAKSLEAHGSVLWLNADNIRTIYNDWDFSEEGRLRQALRMRRLCNSSEDDYKIVDFVAPLQQMRDVFDADYTVWMDTIDEGRFEDTNRLFEQPNSHNLRIKDMDAKKWSTIIVKALNE